MYNCICVFVYLKPFHGGLGLYLIKLSNSELYIHNPCLQNLCQKLVKMNNFLVLR